MVYDDGLYKVRVEHSNMDHAVQMERNLRKHGISHNACQSGPSIDRAARVCGHGAGYMILNDMDEWKMLPQNG